MKKLLVLVSFCILFTACAVPKKQSEMNADSIQTNEDTSEIQETNVPPNNTNDANEGSGEARFLSIQSYEEYLDFIASDEIPNDFITYEMISYMGEFESLTIRSYYYLSDFSAYHYNLVDDLGVEFSIDVRTDKAPEDIVTKNYLMQPPQDIRNIESTQVSYFSHNGMEFLYLQGRLTYIYWYHGQIKITFSGRSSLSTYPTTQGSTFLSNLLNYSTSKATVDSFVQSIVSTLPQG